MAGTAICMHCERRLALRVRRGGRSGRGSLGGHAGLFCVSDRERAAHGALATAPRSSTVGEVYGDARGDRLPLLF